ncbi:MULTISPECIES: hypothetical protein [unclassified Vibrio]|uniref:hypothetical protein n=1 Tax=unclassified Vibrio TaxID=2614977 RepID=UPI0013619859|nr:MULTISPECIES: hypothetical protein [unclassified Vibrio]NAW57771.1 hypothetical protein [Vibrio sp. V36_P2S2PM302]NAX28412.1 hypothetical protein [Vibrio sp. V38_P2S17PM301]NAX29584.1 hypothetical protein [Vibrio sp. V37_P2S8PM304]
MSSTKTDRIISELEQEASKGKVNSFSRLMLMALRAILKELRDIRQFVNSPDEMNRHL